MKELSKLVGSDFAPVVSKQFDMKEFAEAVYHYSHNMSSGKTFLVLNKQE